jgi:hypothetical protein
MMKWKTNEHGMGKKRIQIQSTWDLSHGLTIFNKI